MVRSPWVILCLSYLKMLLIGGHWRCNKFGFEHLCAFKKVHNIPLLQMKIDRSDYAILATILLRHGLYDRD
jgi:hypothetical protein